MQFILGWCKCEIMKLYAKYLSTLTSFYVSAALLEALDYTNSLRSFPWKNPLDRFFQILSIHWLSWGNSKEVIKNGGARLRLRALASQTYHP